MLRRSLRFFIALITDVTVAVIRISIILGHLYDHSKQNYVFFQQHKRNFFFHSFKNFKFTLRLFISVVTVSFHFIISRHEWVLQNEQNEFYRIVRFWNVYTNKCSNYLLYKTYLFDETINIKKWVYFLCSNDQIYRKEYNEYNF